MASINEYQKLFSEYLNSCSLKTSPKNLYQPVKYILGLGGKRIRPILTLLSTDIFDGNTKNALSAALAIEVFHNFSLIHDDIMDKAPLRRGKKTVHEKWDINTAILSGDVMLIWAYELLENYSPKKSYLLSKMFSNTARKVCEGQQLDMEFPHKENISINDYMIMIENKTAVLVGCALSFGAIICEASNDQINQLYNIGIDLGLAFQLQDDYLDAFGDSNKFGKQIGGDIIENKKTFLSIHAINNLSKKHKMEFNNWNRLNPKNANDKIAAVTKFYRSSGALEAIKNKIDLFYESVISKIYNLDLNTNKKESLLNFVNKIVYREF